MDILKISSWLFLVISSLSISECKSFRTYLVPKTTEPDVKLNDNCFCFKQPEGYRKVPEILNLDKNNLERLVVYLYKDKITKQVKLYIPHEEKQALLPDLAFEVGDKLITIENDKVIDLFDINSQTKHIIHNQEVFSKEIIKPNKIPYNFWNHENPLHVDEVSLEKFDAQDNIQYEYPEHSNVSKDVDVTIEVTDNANYDVQYIKPFVNINTLPSKGRYYYEPKLEYNMIPSGNENKANEIVQIEKKYPHYQSTESQDVNILDKTIYIDGQQIKPHVNTYNVPSKPLNIIPGEIVHIDENDSHYYSTESQEVNIPDNTIYIDGQHIKLHVDNYNVPSKPLNVIPGKIVHNDENDSHYYNTESQDVNISDNTINIDGQHIKPHVDNYNIPSKPINIISGEIVHIDENDSHYYSTESQEVNIPDNTINIDGQHIKPHVNTYNVPSKPLNIIPGDIVHIDENDSRYHSTESQEVNNPNNTINIDGQHIKPHVDNYNVPSKPLNIIPGQIVHIDENDSRYHSTESKEVNNPDNTINIDGQHIKPHVETYNVPSKPLNITPGEIVHNDENDSYYYNTESQEVNLPDNTINIDGQHIKPHVDNYNVSLKPLNIIPGQIVHIDENDSRYHSTESKEVNNPDNTINIDGQHIKPHVETYNVPSKPLNIIPGEIVHIDENDSRYHSTESQEVNNPDNTINIDGQHIKPHVETYNVPSKPLNIIPGEIVHIDENDSSYHGTESKEVNIPDNTINIDGQHIKPHVETYNVPSKPLNIIPGEIVHIDENDSRYHSTESQEVNIPDNTINIDGQHIKPHVDNYNVPSKPLNIIPGEIVHIDENNSRYHSTESQEVNVPDNTINIDGQHIKPHVETYNVPSKPLNIIPGEIVHIDENDSHYYNTESQEVNVPDNTINIDGQHIIKPHVDTYNVPSKLLNIIPGEIVHIDENDSSYHSTESQEINTQHKEHRLNSHKQNHYETFDKWFIQQMQLFKTYTEHDRVINLQTIERYILKILLDNDMHVTSEGVLTDSFGNALDVHNLHLRPIFIGNTMAFDTILNYKAKDLVMPANMAYLQAILVTNSNPSMILGIIPIGKTVIPPSVENAFSTVLKPYVPSKWKTPGYYSHYSTIGNEPISYNENRVINNANTEYYIGRKKPIVLHLTNGKQNSANMGLKTGKTVITVLKDGPVLVQSQHRNRQPVKTVKVYGAHSFSGSDEYVLSNNSAEEVNKLLLSLKEGSDPMKSAEATNKLLSSLRSGNGPAVSVVTDESGEITINEDDITERIVGGQAATSSGAPLSVKGRMKDF